MPATIPAHRRGVLVIRARAGTAVRVEQRRHAFWFGAALSSSAFGDRWDAATRERYFAAFSELFNSAVTENALKWHAMERERGAVRYDEVDAMLAYCEQHALPLRGHNIFWGVPNMVQPWLKELDDATLRATLRDRALDVATRYRGRFAEYDLNNEMIHGNWYADRLGPRITRDMADWVREGDPGAVLYLNDYDITTGRRVDDYVRHLEELLAMGVPIGGIGVQGHLHAETFDPVALEASLDKLAPFGLPVRVTEFNIPGQRSRYYQDRDRAMTAEEEQQKAEGLVDFYRRCFAHPAVTGILMWGFWAGANWIPASSLFARDWTELPAAAAYRRLVFDELWTRWRGEVGEAGAVEVPAVLGEHDVTIGDRLVTARLTGAAERVTVE